MSAGAARLPWPAARGQALLVLFLTFPGVFLPLDVLYAGPGIAVFATAQQAARIFLYSAALSVLLSLLACALCVALRRHAAAAALWLALTLVAFAVFNGLVVWSSYYIEYAPSLLWLRRLLTLAASIPAGYLLARHLRAEPLAGLLAVLRASTAVVALAVLGCGALLMLDRAQALPQPSGVRAGAQPPSIILITVDALSALHLPMYGYARPTAPRLAQFAQGATLFLRNYADSNFTTPSVSSLLYGRRPWVHRALQLEATPLRRLAPESLPAVLQAAGYFTASVSTNPWAAPAHLGIADRFAVLAEHRICAAANPVYLLPADLQIAVGRSLVGGIVAGSVVRLASALDECKQGHFDPELALSAARRILATAPPGQPVFLWIHLYPPHDPYLAPAPFVGTFDASAQGRTRSTTNPPYLFEARVRLDFPGVLPARYDEAIRYVDHHIGAFLDELRKTDRYDRSLIVVTADHGESFTHGYGNHDGPMLHEELVRVPLIIKAPGQRQGGKSSELSEQVDLLPTILDLAGIQAPHDGEGVSLVPAMKGQALHRPLFLMNLEESPRSGALATGSVAMLDGQWKYVHYFGDIRYPYMPPLQDELYDLSADPWETSNQRALQADVAARMQREIEARLREHGGRLE